MPNPYLIRRSGLAPAVNPLVIPGLVTAIYGNAQTGAHGAALATVVDSGPAGTNWTQGTAGSRPTRLTTSETSPRGNALIRFDGVDDFLQHDFTVPGFPGNGFGYTFLFWANWLSSVNGTGAQIPFGDDTDLRPQLIADEAGAGLQGGYRDESSTYLGGAYQTGFHLYTWQFHTATALGGDQASWFSIDGIVQKAQTPWNWNSFASGPLAFLGGNAPSDTNQHFDLGVFLWYANNALTDAQLLAVGDALMDY
jgi:hypothetical protein